MSKKIIKDFRARQQVKEEQINYLLSDVEKNLKQYMQQQQVQFLEKNNKQYRYKKPTPKKY